MFGVTLIWIVLFVVPPNVSVAFIKKGWAPPAKIDVSVLIDDVVLALAVTTAVDEFIANLSAVYPLWVAYVIVCPSESVAETVPTIESISSNSSILKETEFIVGDVLGKNIDSKKFCIEPDVPKLLLYTPDGKSVLDTVLLPSNAIDDETWEALINPNSPIWPAPLTIPLSKPVKYEPLTD